MQNEHSKRAFPLRLDYGEAPRWGGKGAVARVVTCGHYPTNLTSNDVE